jgi:nucleoside-diphosphate-sugar epimerase
MKILVSGASGFVGRNLIKFLKNLDCEVLTISMFQKDLMSLAMQIKHLDKQLQKIESQIRDVHTFVHLAWMDTNDWNSSVHKNINKQLSEYLIRRLCSGGIEHVIVAGTCLEYGVSGGNLSEILPAKPKNEYALAKYALYKSIRMMANKDEFELSWLRLFYIFGGDQPPTTIYGSMMEQIIRGETTFNMSSGQQVRDYLHIDTVCQMILAVVMSKQGFDVVNICSGQGLTLEKHVRSWLHDISPKINLSLNLGALPDRKDEPFHLWGSSHKFNSLLN